jgi:hypothetical protein
MSRAVIRFRLLCLPVPENLRHIQGAENENP